MATGYTPGFKEASLQKMLSRGSKSIKEIAEGVGVAPGTLYCWKRECGSVLGEEKNDRRPKDWPVEEKFEAVMEFGKLKNEEQGEFLRKKGLHTDHLEVWKKEMKASLGPNDGHQALRQELLECKRTIKELEKDLHRKDKALAETTALLVLKKKADLIWGIIEEKK